MDQIAWRDLTPEDITEVSNSPYVAIDIETDGLTYDGAILGLAAAWLDEAGEEQSIYLNMGHMPSLFYSRHSDGTIHNLLSAAYRSPRLFLHAAPFDLGRLKRWGWLQELPDPSRMVDTQITARLAFPFDHGGSSSLVRLCDRLLEDPFPLKEMKGQRSKLAQLPAEAVEAYGRADAVYTLRLGRSLLHKMTEVYGKSLAASLLKREARFANLLTHMWITGIGLDMGFVERKKAELLEKRTKVAERLEKEWGLKNPAARGEQIRIITETTGLDLPKTEKGNPSINEDALRAIGGDLCKYILRWRGYGKAISTWLDGYVAKLGSDGRLHASFNAAGTISARLSCSKPNLTAVPLEERDHIFGSMAGLFAASADRELWAFDLSQAELRLAAMYAGSDRLAEIFASGEDVHIATAELIFPGEEITKKLRTLGKGANYTLTYGGGALALSMHCRIDETEARGIIKRHHRAFPKMAQTLNQVSAVWESRGHMTLLSGRRRWMGSNEKAKSYKAFNQLIQGGIAEMVKDAMLTIDQMLGTRGAVLLQIHDSVELEMDGPVTKDDLAGIKAAMAGTVPHRIQKRTTPRIEVKVDAERWA